MEQDAVDQLLREHGFSRYEEFPCYSNTARARTITVSLNDAGGRSFVSQTGYVTCFLACWFSSLDELELAITYQTLTPFPLTPGEPSS